MAEPHAPPLPVQAQKITSSLHPRVWTLGRGASPGRRALVFLTDGAGQCETGDAAHDLKAPCLFWLALPRDGRLRLTAGSTGYLVEIEEEATGRAVGDYAESLSLRFMADRSMLLTLAGQAPACAAIVQSFEAILIELQTPQAGSAMLLAAHLRVILVVMFRVLGAEEILQSGGGDSARILQRFRQLVEANFRAHWSVALYAKALSISHDRLHAICTRELGKTPKALISERLAREAALGLERSLLTIEQLSDALGFRDPAHFSHFFKRITGTPPGAYRQTMTASARTGAGVEPASFADWP